MNGSQFQDFYFSRKKFVKPYAECTRYTDSLNKNKELLRRGQFDMPLKDSSLCNVKKTNLTNRNTNYSTMLKKSKMHRGLATAGKFRSDNKDYLIE
jgi:hypothetical protein